MTPTAEDYAALQRLVTSQGIRLMQADDDIERLRALLAEAEAMLCKFQGNVKVDDRAELLDRLAAALAGSSQEPTR
jgi:hypothetical protein